MSKKNHEGNVALEEQELAAEQAATNDEIMAEEPKTKVGDQAVTTVDGVATPGKKARVSTPKGIPTFRALDGVDPAKYIGQRGTVIRSLQKLALAEGGDKYFTHEQIVANVEGLVTRCAVADSVMYHLKGLVADKLVALEVITPAATEPAPAA
jgi:hypothetical protein